MKFAVPFRGVVEVEAPTAAEAEARVHLLIAAHTVKLDISRAIEDPTPRVVEAVHVKAPPRVWGRRMIQP